MAAQTEYLTWLSGFADLSEAPPTQKQWDIIKNKLQAALVGAVPVEAPTTIELSVGPNKYGRYVSFRPLADKAADKTPSTETADEALKTETPLDEPVRVMSRAVSSDLDSVRDISEAEVDARYNERLRFIEDEAQKHIEQQKAQIREDVYKEIERVRAKEWLQSSTSPLRNFIENGMVNRANSTILVGSREAIAPNNLEVQPFRTSGGVNVYVPTSTNQIVGDDKLTTARKQGLVYYDPADESTQKPKASVLPAPSESHDKMDNRRLSTIDQVLRGTTYTLNKLD